MVVSRAAVFCWNVCVLDITLQKTTFTFIVITLTSHKETCSLYAVSSLMVQLVEPLRYKAEGRRVFDFRWGHWDYYLS